MFVNLEMIDISSNPVRSRHDHTDRAIPLGLMALSAFQVPNFSQSAKSVSDAHDTSLRLDFRQRVESAATTSWTDITGPPPGLGRGDV